MSAKRGASGLSGVLLVDKPAGCTSHDVVNRIRRATGERRVGHAGTLDPSATGLLVVLVGPYTRLEPYLSSEDKGYSATIVFGSETDTDDADGSVIHTSPVAPALAQPAYARSVLERLLGDSLQTPPAYSAIKVGGRVAHRVARSGGSLEVPDRPIRVLSAELTGVSADGDGLRWDVAFLVSKGTYIRALARDIGRLSGSAAHLGALRRTSAADTCVSQAHSLEEIDAAGLQGRVGDLFADAVSMTRLPALAVDPAAIADGRPVPAPAGTDPRFAIVVEGRLRAIYRRKGEILQAEAVFALPEVGAR